MALPCVASYLFEIENEADLRVALAFCREQGKPWVVLGGGSNLLLPPRLDACVLRMQRRTLTWVRADENRIRVRLGAGSDWHGFVCWCVEQGFGGVENLALIPGTAGAAPVQNIGAYGVELADVLESVTVYDVKHAIARELDADACRLGYRESIFKQCPGEFIILDICLRLTAGNHVFKIGYGDISQRLGGCAPDIKSVFEAVVAARTSKLPDPARLANAGSFFKNPVISLAQLNVLQQHYPALVYYPVTAQQVKLAAAWLIERAGWKGIRHGAVGVHANQALVLVNYGGATRAEVLALAQQIEESVFARFGVTLEREPVVL